MAGEEDGRHRLRHVGRAPLPQRRPPRGGDGPADERGARPRRASRGVLIIHAPSSCMDAYKDHPARKRAQAAPKAAKTCPRTSASGAARSRPRRRATTRSTRPTAARTTTRPSTPSGTPSSRRWAATRRPPGRRRTPCSRSTTRTPSATRASRSGTCSSSAGINNVILLGVHTNMCVLGRPFGLRQMAKNGKNVVLMRDMTDTMYNPAPLAVRQPLQRHGPDRRAHREVRLPDDHQSTRSSAASRSASRATTTANDGQVCQVCRVGILGRVGSLRLMRIVSALISKHLRSF